MNAGRRCIRAGDWRNILSETWASPALGVDGYVVLGPHPENSGVVLIAWLCKGKLRFSGFLRKDVMDDEVFVEGEGDAL